MMDLALLLVFAAEDLHGPLAGRVHRHLADGIAVPGGDRGHLVPINTCPYTCTRTVEYRQSAPPIFTLGWQERGGGGGGG